MKEISNSWLENNKKDYLNDDKLNVLRRCLVKNPISESMYVLERESEDSFMFSIDIPTMPVTDQKQSGRCWIFAGLNVLREIIGKKFNIDNFEFSQSYVAFYDKLEKVNFALEKLIELRKKEEDDRVLLWILDGGIADGGQWDMFVNIIEKYGLVSKNAMLETFISGSTREVNYFVNALIRKFNQEVRECKNINQARELKEKTMKEVYNLLTTCYGVPPSEFNFEYVDKNKEYHIQKGITPKEFYKNYVGDTLKDYVSIINAPTKDKPFNKCYTVDYLGNVIEGKSIKYLNLELNEFKEVILNQLKDREVVWFGSDCARYGDRSKGIWDDKLFSYNQGFGINFDLTKESSLVNRHSAMNHAMVLTGVNLDNEIPTRWKIENSWGDKVANRGYYICSDSWFDRFVYQAVVNKKYLTKKQSDMLKGKVTHLNPWDPMGTLAD